MRWILTAACTLMLTPSAFAEDVKTTKYECTFKDGSKVVVEATDGAKADAMCLEAYHKNAKAKPGRPTTANTVEPDDLFSRRTLMR